MSSQFLKWINSDICDLAFRWAFSSIFLGLGLEHLFVDDTIQLLMPVWVSAPRLISVACGLILVFGGSLIFLGIRLRLAASILAIFLIVVTISVHAPGLLKHPLNLPTKWVWLWDVLQRSNFVKNVCLFGMCMRLLHYQVGRFSLQAHLNGR